MPARQRIAYAIATILAALSMMACAGGGLLWSMEEINQREAEERATEIAAGCPNIPMMCEEAE